MLTGLINEAKITRDDPNSKLGTNQTVDEIIDEIVGALGLSKEQRELLHRAISKKELTPEQIWEIAQQIKDNFGGKSKSEHQGRSRGRK